MDNYINVNPDVDITPSEADQLRQVEEMNDSDDYEQQVADSEAESGRELEELANDEDIREEVYSDYSSVINYHNITHDDMLNGDGLRVVLWVAGCSHHCKGCQNPCTWDPNGGIPLTEKDEAEFWEWLEKSWTKGATFSGGDPLHPANREYIGQMMEKIKGEYPGKDIWVYTGYTLTKLGEEFVLTDECGSAFSYPQLKYVDVLVDGLFMENLRKEDITLQKTVHWRGSSNQRVIDVQKTLYSGEIVVRDCDKEEPYCYCGQKGGCGE